MEQVETWVDERAPITEERIRKLHAILFSGKRSKPTPYRDGQNVIRDRLGHIVYMPPETQDVPILMTGLVNWMQRNKTELPIPLIAGIAHYQFVTIHPFYDGNGRTARGLATWVLYQGGYDLGRYYSLEEFYMQDLQGYYAALVTHPHHNYYDGRDKADITSWLTYFLKGMASVFETVAQVVRKEAYHGDESNEVLLRKLDRRERLVLGLFSGQNEITANEVARVLGLSARQTRDLLSEWIEQGWLEISNKARKSRRYQLSAEYRRFIGGLSVE